MSDPNRIDSADLDRHITRGDDPEDGGWRDRIEPRSVLDHEGYDEPTTDTQPRVDPERLVEAVIVAAELAIGAAGFTLRYQEFCEDSETPGMLGYYGGVTMRDRRTVKIATHEATRPTIALRLVHELRHVLEPEWECGNRGGVLGDRAREQDK